MNLKDEIFKLIGNQYNPTDDWRFENGEIEWAIGADEHKKWFPLYRATQEIEKLVNAWIDSGGLSSFIDTTKKINSISQSD